MASARALLFAALLGAAFLAHAQEEPSLGGYKLSEFPAAGAAPVFKLLSAGEDSRRALRYRLKPGITPTMVLTMRMTLGVELDGRGAPLQRAPAMRMVFDCRVTEADERGARFDFGLAQPPELFETEGVAPATLEAMRKSLSALGSIRGQVAVSDRGVVKEARVEVGAGLDQSAAKMIQSMQQSVEQTSVPLPEEAVGVGAEWKLLQRVQGGGVSVYQVAHFKVLRFEGAVVTVAVALEQLAPKQAMAVPPEAAGTQLELASMQGRGEGHVAIDLTSPVPRSSLSLDSTLIMDMRSQDRTARMGMRNRMQVQIEPGTP